MACLEFSQHLIVDLKNLKLYLELIFCFYLLPHEISDILMLWVENDALPIFSPDREALKARFDSVFEHGLLVKSNIKDANNASLFQPDHIL